MNKQHHHLSVREMSDQEVTNRYSKETLKLKTLNQFGRQSKRFLGYPNTLMMNLCKQELERRGLPIPTVSPQGKAPMTEQAYLAEVLRTYAGSEAQLDKLCLGALGLAGETGEIVDAIKKAMYQGHGLDRTHLLQELGDVLWYFMLICHALDLSLDEVMRGNVEKLHRRYPASFESERSRCREEGAQP